MLLCEVHFERRQVTQESIVKDKDNKKRDVDSTTFKMVRAIAKGNNVDAYKLLEKVTKKKMADKIDSALDSKD